MTTKTDSVKIILYNNTYRSTFDKLSPFFISMRRICADALRHILEKSKLETYHI